MNINLVKVRRARCFGSKLRVCKPGTAKRSQQRKSSREIDDIGQVVAENHRP
jgi:hypothetical protein